METKELVRSILTLNYRELFLRKRLFNFAVLLLKLKMIESRNFLLSMMQRHKKITIESRIRSKVVVDVLHFIVT